MPLSEMVLIVCWSLSAILLVVNIGRKKHYLDIRYINPSVLHHSIQYCITIIRYITFDMDQLNGKIIVAYIAESNEATIKKYIKDDPIRFLKPFNSIYSVILFTEDNRVIGVVKLVLIGSYTK